MLGNENKENNHLVFSNLYSNKRNKFRAVIRSQKNQNLFNQTRFSTMQNFFGEIGKNFNPQPQTEEIKTLKQNISLMIFAFESQPDYTENLYDLRNILMDIYKVFSPNGSYDSIIESKIPIILLDLLKNEKKEISLDGRVEAARCLLILTTGTNEDGEKLIKMNIIEILMKCLDEKIEKNEFFELVLATLANLCYITENRRKMFENDIVLRILNLAFHNNISGINVVKSMLYLIKCLCIEADYEDVKYLFDPVLIYIIQIPDPEIHCDCIEIISKIGEKTNNHYIEKILTQEMFLKSLNFFLISTEPTIVENSLKIISSITFGNKNQIFVLVKNNIFETLLKIIELEKCENQKKILIIFTNIIKEDDKNVELFVRNNFFESCHKYLLFGRQDLIMEVIELLFTSIYAAKIKTVPYICLPEIMSYFISQLNKDENDLNFIIELLSLMEYLIQISFNESKYDNPYYLVLIKSIENGVLDHYEYHLNNMISNIVLRTKELLNKIIKLN